MENVVPCVHKLADCWESVLISTRELGIKLHFKSFKQIDNEN